jgi:hypothetical protein
MRALAILTVKNEAAFLLDWLAHHRACGFTDFLIFSNDCSDGTDAMLDRLAEMHWLIHVRNDGAMPEGPQWAALKAADRHPVVRDADWILVCDIDEYVNVHTGNGSLTALLSALPQATAIPLTWRMFGNAGVIDYVDLPVTEQFIRAAPATLAWPWRAQLFKTLFRNDGTYRKLGVHRPRSPNPDRLAGAVWCDGSGRTLSARMHTTGIISDYRHDTCGLVQLNHYALGAMESYLVKCDRGRANRDAAAFDMGYWVDRNFDAVDDPSILLLNSQPHRDELRRDPVLADLHIRAVTWRHARFADLMTAEPWRAFFGRLLMCPASTVLTAQTAAPLLRHIQRQA